VEALRVIAAVAESVPEAIQAAPVTTEISRPDELRAAKAMDFAAE
jgi:hypothetical protein